MISRRRIARRLESIADFSDPDLRYEQYLTSAEVTAYILHVASLRADLQGRSVIDLGTGTGMFAIGAAFYSPDRIIGVEIDPDALSMAVSNERSILDPKSPSIDWVLGDVQRLPLCTSNATVFSNPPFGATASNRNADRAFLESTSTIAAVSYTIHNEGSRNFIEAFAADNDATVTDVFEAEMTIPARFEHHTRNRWSFNPEVYRIEW